MVRISAGALLGEVPEVVKKVVAGALLWRKGPPMWVQVAAAGGRFVWCLPWCVWPAHQGGVVVKDCGVVFAHQDTRVEEFVVRRLCTRVQCGVVVVLRRHAESCRGAVSTVAVRRLHTGGGGSTRVPVAWECQGDS